MTQSGWLAGLLVGLAIGLSGLSGVAVGAWWATPAKPAGPQVAMPKKFLPPAPDTHRIQASVVVD